MDEIILQRNEIQQLKAHISKQDLLIKKLQEQVNLLQHLHFGPKSEKKTKEDTLTTHLFNEAEDAAFSQISNTESEKVKQTTEVKGHQRRRLKNQGRKSLDASLPREVAEYDIDEEEKICTCGSELKCIGEDVTERLKIYPVKAVVLQERKKKYTCCSCEGLEREDEKGIVTAKGPKHLIPGSIADESFLAWSISEKFEFALPFYRQSIRLGQIGAPIPRATLSNTTIQAGRKCEPIYELLKKNIQSGYVINADETRAQVLKEPNRKNQTKSWMWVFLGGEVDKKSVIFQYETSRSHEVPYEFLKDFSGCIQTDDYEAYHTAVKKIRNNTDKEIYHMLCWAHVRRKFYQYWEDSKDPIAEKIIELINDLFKLEKLREKYSKKRFVNHRKIQAEMVFQDLRKILLDVFPATPPSLFFGKAISYTLDNWEQLITYVDHHDLTPSNNIAERAIRPFCIGRKNWLFSGSPDGAKASAILYSLVESAKLHQYSAYEYLYYVFRKIPYCKTQADYEALLPHNLDEDEVRGER